IFAFVDLQPALFAGFHWLVHDIPTWSHMTLAIVSPTVLGAFVVFLRKHPVWSKLVMGLFWFAGPLAFFVLYFALTGEFVMNWMKLEPEAIWWQTPWMLLEFGPFAGSYLLA